MTGKGTPALALLTKHKIPHTVHTYEHDRGAESYGLEAVSALGIDADRVFKTLVAQVDDHLTVGIVPVAELLDLKALAAAVGGKRARMADPQIAERATGYVRGGISPLGHRTKIPVVIDRAALTHSTLYCSAGRRGLEVELAGADLIRLTDATVADITHKRQRHW